MALQLGQVCTTSLQLFRQKGMRQHPSHILTTNTPVSLMDVVCLHSSLTNVYMFFVYNVKMFFWAVTSHRS